MHDPMTQIYSCRFFTLWHVDPERGPGGDDSCGWFKRAHHGDKSVLEKIQKRFEEDWDRVYVTKEENHDSEDGEFRPETYFCGWFCPNGAPHYSVHGIVLNLFFTAVGIHFHSDGCTNWKRARTWMQANLFDILMFAENSTDSLFDVITRKFEIGCGEEYTPATRAERIERIAAVIYGWILRREQKWWQHPRWHIHHWRLQIPLFHRLHRRLFIRCAECGKSFAWNETPISSWEGNRIWHQRCDRTIVKAIRA